MAVAYDSGNGGETSFNITATVSYTMPSLTNACLVWCNGAAETLDVSAVAYNSDALTEAKEQLNENVCGAQIWYLVNPDTGTNNAVGTSSEFNNWDIWVAGLSGVDQSTPIANTGGTNTFSSTASTTVNTGVASGDMAVDCVMTQNTRTLTVGADQSQKYNHDHSNQGMTGVSTEPLTGTSVTMSWGISSNDNWAQAVAVFKAAAGATVVIKDIIGSGFFAFPR